MSKRPTKPRIRTLEQARAYVRSVGICAVFSSKKGDLPVLWDVVDLPDKQPGEKGWGKKVNAVWRWKNQLPARFPDEIFYGKAEGGIAVLMTLDHLRASYYAQVHRPIESCSSLAREVFDLVRSEPLITTGELRKAILQKHPAARSAFQRALTEAQVTLNIVRCNSPEITTDAWLRFTEQYPEFV